MKIDTKKKKKEIIVFLEFLITLVYIKYDFSFLLSEYIYIYIYIYTQISLRPAISKMLMNSEKKVLKMP